MLGAVNSESEFDVNPALPEMINVVLVNETVDFLIAIALAVTLIALMFAFEHRKRKRARKKWFANRSGEPDLLVDDDPTAAAMVTFIAADADVPAELLRAGDGIDVLFDIGLDDEELLPFIRRRFGVKLKSADVCPLVKQEEGWRARPISLGELIALIRERQAALQAAEHGGIVSWLRSCCGLGQ
jgi:hypothetical protein